MSDFLLSALLRDWYADHKRELPWRETRDPYKIWISEIILQQTRVQQGLDYYTRFIHRFPDIHSLAEAPLDEVLKYWQGLGYYSRARNLHAAAQQVEADFGGVFPHTYETILTLKGIGGYTAAAIASFAYDLPCAVLDGNVYRVLARLFASATPIDTTQGKKEFQLLADTLLDPRYAAIHNQAIMELGALQCTPVSPDCDNCPLKDHCMAFAENRVAEFPVKQGKTKIRERWFYYFLIEEGDFLYLHQRTDKDIWSHLYEFPLIETDHAVTFEELCRSESFYHLLGKEVFEIAPLWSRKHILSHQHIHALFYRVKSEGIRSLSDSYIRIHKDDLEKYPVSRLTHLCIEQL